MSRNESNEDVDFLVEDLWLEYKVEFLFVLGLYHHLTNAPLVDKQPREISFMQDVFQCDAQMELYISQFERSVVKEGPGQ